MVMEFASLGCLRTYLHSNFNNITCEKRLKALVNISMGLKSLHESGLTHHDFHPGNLLFVKNFGGEFLNIADLGLCRTVEDCKSHKIMGVLPYIAPEVLCKKKYTKESDVYSFGMVTYEWVTGIPPFYNFQFDFELASRIVSGLRPKIPEYIPNFIADLIIQCWDGQPEKRPTSEQLTRILTDWYNEIRIKKESELKKEIAKYTESAKSFSSDLLRIELYKSKPITFNCLTQINDLKYGNQNLYSTTQIDLTIPD
ncbi:27010_t:CDS:2, partial [Gigaspora margarita]